MDSFPENVSSFVEIVECYTHFEIISLIIVSSSILFLIIYIQYYLLISINNCTSVII